MYNVALAGFETLQETQEKRKDETSTIAKQLIQLEKEHKQVIELFESGRIDQLPRVMDEQIIPQYEELAENYEQKIYFNAHNIDLEDTFYQKYTEAGLLEDIDKQVINDVEAYWDKHYKKQTWPVHHLAYYNQTGKIEPRIIPQEVLNLDILPILNNLKLILNNS